MDDAMHVRTIALIGEKGMERLKRSTVCVMGAGGVGSYAIEALARAGVGTLVVADHGTVEPSNINRQLIALHSTLGKPKTEVVRERVLDINPGIRIVTHGVFISKENIGDIVPDPCHYIIDAVDTVWSKVEIAWYAASRGIPLLSCMGTGKKTDPSRFVFGDLSETRVCPLARKMRSELKKRGLGTLNVLYSEEPPAKHAGKVIPSISFVPSVAGLMLAGRVVLHLASETGSGCDIMREEQVQS